MEKEYLLMTMVTADKEIDNEIIRAYPIGIKADENIWIHPDRLIDKDDVDYGEPRAGDIYFDRIKKATASQSPTNGKSGRIAAL